MIKEIKAQIKSELKNNGTYDKQKYIEKYKDLLSVECFDVLFSLVEMEFEYGK